MKKSTFGVAAVALGLVVGVNGVASAQEKTHIETTTTQTGPGPGVQTKTEWLSGTVKDYEPGKSIKVSGPEDKSYSFDLDGDARVHGTIVVGQAVRVGYWKSADGVEHVTVVSAASASSQAAATAPRAHTEAVTKETRPGTDLKTRSEVVVGTVKEYEAGKSIKVTGPGDKDYSFDLDKAAGVKGPIAVGERVRVTYTRTSDGDRVTTVEPARARG